MMRCLLVALAFAASASAQPGSLAERAGVTAFDGAGEAVSLRSVVDAAADADVLYLGETHDDSTAHALQLDLLAEVVRQSGGRAVVLGLEMFETDVQPVLDEYLGGLISERDFLAAARPWSNYEADYRPLVEFARGAGLPVLATNAPARYVRAVARDGFGALAGLSDTALGWVAPLPIAPSSPETEAAFRALMGEMAGHGGPSVDGMLAAQTLRDATMADRIATALARRPGALVVHVNGSFHSAGGRGIPEHVARRVAGARQVVVTMRPDDGSPAAGEGDFVVLTPAR